MTSQKQHFPSFATTVSALGILLYCIGFLRIELELNNQKKRLKALENNPETKPPSSDSNIVKIIKDVRGMYKIWSSRFTQPLNIVYNFINSKMSLTILKKNILRWLISHHDLTCLLITIRWRLSVLAQVAQAHHQSPEQHYGPYSLFYYSCSDDSVLKRNVVWEFIFLLCK